MQIIVFVALAAMAQGAVLYPKTRVVDAPFQRTTIQGPSGVISTEEKLPGFVREVETVEQEFPYVQEEYPVVEANSVLVQKDYGYYGKTYPYVKSYDYPVYAGHFESPAVYPAYYNYPKFYSANYPYFGQKCINCRYY